jgi:hypothetical protein
MQQLVESLYPKTTALKKSERATFSSSWLFTKEARLPTWVAVQASSPNSLSRRGAIPQGLLLRHLSIRRMAPPEAGQGSNLKKQHMKNAVVIRGKADDPKLPKESVEQ